MNFFRTAFVVLVVYAVCARTLFLRLIRGPKHPGWTLRTELWLEGVRAVFAASHRFLSFAYQRRAVVLPLPGRIKRRLSHEYREINGRRAEIHTPHGLDAAAPTILYFHGGGYIMCSPGTHRSLAARLALASSARCVVPAYRLAPEHPFPAAIEDCLAAYEALLAEGVAPERLLLAGDSAGGGLVLAVLQRLRAQRRPLPCGALLLSPWVDPAGEGGTLESNVAFDYLMPSMLAMASSMYVGTGHMKDPEICILGADLTDLPPMLVHAGEAEIFYSQQQAFVARAQAAQVDVTFESFPGMVHVFQMFGFLSESRTSLRAMGRFVQSRVGNLTVGSET